MKKAKLYAKSIILIAILILFDQMIKTLIPNEELVLIPRIIEAYICTKYRWSFWNRQ